MKIILSDRGYALILAVTVPLLILSAVSFYANPEDARFIAAAIYCGAAIMNTLLAIIFFVPPRKREKLLRALLFLFKPPEKDNTEGETRQD